MNSPGVFADLAAQRACWHPVAFAGEVDRPARARRPARRAAGGLAWHRRRAAGDVRSVRAPRHRAVAGPDPGRRAGVCLPRLAVRRRRPVRGDPAKGRSGGGSGQGPGPGIPRAGTVRADLGRAGGAPVAAARGPGTGNRRVGDRGRPGPTGGAATRPGRWRTSPTSGTSPGSTRGCSATRSGPVVPRHQVHADGHVLRYEIVRPEAPNSDDFPVFGNEQAGPPQRRSRYELHLPYTIVLRLGWGGERGHGVLLRLAAGGRRPLRRLTWSSAGTTTPISRTR